MGFAGCTSHAAAYQFEVLFVAAQEVAVELLEDLLGLVSQILKVKVRVVPLH